MTASRTIRRLESSGGQSSRTERNALQVVATFGTSGRGNVAKKMAVESSGPDKRLAPRFEQSRTWPIWRLTLARTSCFALPESEGLLWTARRPAPLLPLSRGATPTARRLLLNVRPRHPLMVTRAREGAKSWTAPPRKRVAVPPKGDSYALRHEQSERPFVLHCHGLTVTARGLGQGPNRDHDAGRGEPFHLLAKPLSGRAGRPPSFSKLALPVQDRLSIYFERLGA
jgi:hypothetical protein